MDIPLTYSNSWMAGSIDDMGVRSSPDGSHSNKHHKDPLLVASLSAGTTAAEAAKTEREAMMMRRPRGRPAGSKNKPKPPIIITRDSANALRAHAMEVTSGSDIHESLINFARKKQRGIFILSGVGCVMNVTLRQPTNSSSPSPSSDHGPGSGGGGAIMAHLHGQFEIVSLMGSILPPPAPPGVTGITIYMAAGPQGQVVGGSVVGALIAAGPVVIMAATFMNATFDRLPLSPSASEFDDGDHNYDDQAHVARGKGNDNGNPVHQNNIHNQIQNYYQNNNINNHLPRRQQQQHLHNRHRVDASDLYGMPLVTEIGSLVPVNAYPWAPGRSLTKN